MPQRDIVVMGASAGEVDAWKRRFEDFGQIFVRASSSCSTFLCPKSSRESVRSRLFTRTMEIRFSRGTFTSLHRIDIYWYETVALSSDEDPKRITRGPLSIRCSSQQPRPMAEGDRRHPDGLVG